MNHKLEILVKDLFRLGNFSNWVPPNQIENINWFQHNNKVFNDGEAVAQRLKELISIGADISNKFYLISNVNKIEPVKVALNFGSNPNIPGKSGMLSIDRAITKGRTKIAEAIIDYPDFNFNSNLAKNVLFLAIENGKYQLANKIAVKKPELLSSNNEEGNSIIYSLSEYLSNGNKINSKVYLFLEKALQYYNQKNIDFSILESKNGKTIKNNSIEIAEFILEKQALKLESILPTNKQNGSSVKLKI